MNEQMRETITLSNAMLVRTKRPEGKNTTGIVFPIMVSGKAGTAYLSLTDIALADPEARVDHHKPADPRKRNPYAHVRDAHVSCRDAMDAELSADSVLPIQISGPAADTLEGVPTHSTLGWDGAVVTLENTHGELLAAHDQGESSVFMRASDIALMAQAGRELMCTFDQELFASGVLTPTQVGYDGRVIDYAWELAPGDQKPAPSLDRRHPVHANNVIAIQEITGLFDSRYLAQRRDDRFFGTYRTEPVFGKSRQLAAGEDSEVRSAALRRMASRLPMSCNIADIACSPQDAARLSLSRQLEPDELTVPITGTNPIGLPIMREIGTFETHMDWPLTGTAQDVQAKMIEAQIDVAGTTLPCYIVYDNHIKTTETIISGHPMGNEYRYEDYVADTIRLGHLENDSQPRIAIEPSSDYTVLIGMPSPDDDIIVDIVDLRNDNSERDIGAKRDVHTWRPPTKTSYRSRPTAHDLATEFGSDMLSQTHPDTTWVSIAMPGKELAKVITTPQRQAEAMREAPEATAGPTPAEPKLTGNFLHARARKDPGQRTPIASPDWDEPTDDAQMTL